MNNIILSTPLPMDQNPAVVYVASLNTATGRRSQKQALQAIADVLQMPLESVNWASLRYQHTAAIRAQLTERYAPATANKILSALRQTLKQAWLLGQMPVDDYMKASNLKPVTGHTEPAGRYLSSDEISAMLTACNTDPNHYAGIRDAAMIALMYICLLRREEIANLTLSSYNPHTGELLVIGKRNKERINYVQNGAKDALDRWLAIRGNTPGALFVAVNKSGRITNHENFTPQTVYKMISKRSTQAGIENNSPHNFRRTGASDYLNITDPLTVSQIGGWESLQTLKRYDRRPEEAKKQAAAALKIPL